jgi:hypothetical protein
LFLFKGNKDKNTLVYGFWYYVFDLRNMSSKHLWTYILCITFKKLCLNMRLLDGAGDLAVTLGLPGRHVRSGGVDGDAVDVVRVPGVVALRVRLQVVEDRHRGHVVHDLARGQVVLESICLKLFRPKFTDET